MLGAHFLSVAAILIANGIGGFTAHAELSLTLLQHAVDKVLFNYKGGVVLIGSMISCIGRCMFRWITTRLLL